jgi:putative intracellular protease/amidase
LLSPQTIDFGWWGQQPIKKKYMKSLHSLLITTSNNKIGDTENKTGVWLEDLAAPYFILKDGGEFITIASPLGSTIPLDPNCETTQACTEDTLRFQNDAKAMYQFNHSLPLSSIKATDYDLVFLVGGYGAMWDFNNNPILNGLLKDFYVQNKPIGLVGHAVAALTTLSINSEELLIKNRKLTAFSNSEEASIKLNEKPPFLLETKLIVSGALYEKVADFKSLVVVDGSIVTGQNPASAKNAAIHTLAMARAQVKENITAS